MRLAMRIRVARQHARLSQAELAERLGVSRGAVANWESVEDAHPVASRLVKLAVLTNVSIEWLATGRGPMICQADPHEVPAVDGEFVYDPGERRLLDAFRSNPAHLRQLILQLAESHGCATRRSPVVRRA